MGIFTDDSILFIGALHTSAPFCAVAVEVVRTLCRTAWAAMSVTAMASAPHAEERVALVVGNAAFAVAATGQCARSDANSMSELLMRAGFIVDKQLDVDRAQLQAAVDRFGRAIQDPKIKLGVFYYAGHGVQVNWRNYIIPIGAEIRSAVDVPIKGVDVSDVMQYMKVAGDRSFLVILDACRDDPFKSSFRPPLKGLSQYDAPSGVLLAYATAPGKVALDGDGNNGLYTSYLLRELGMKGIRLEDAFKRVRLSVRLASGGVQIPWEATSLEADVYLFPVKQPELTEDERDQLLEREMKGWLNVKLSDDPKVLAEFIREFPSGSASELAQSRLNRIFARAADRELERNRREAAEAQAKASAQAAGRIAEAERLTAAKAEGERLAMESADRERAQLTKAYADRVEADREGQLRKDWPRRNGYPAKGPRLERRAAQSSADVIPDKPAGIDRQGAERVAQDERSSSLQRDAEKAAPMATTVAPPLMPVLEATPFYQGFNEHLREYTVGDETRVAVIDAFTGISKPLLLRVTGVDLGAERVTYNDGEFESDMMGNATSNRVGTLSTPRQFYPAEFLSARSGRRGSNKRARTESLTRSSTTSK